MFLLCLFLCLILSEIISISNSFQLSMVLFSKLNLTLFNHIAFSIQLISPYYSIIPDQKGFSLHFSILFVTSNIILFSLLISNVGNCVFFVTSLYLFLQGDQTQLCTATLTISVALSILCPSCGKKLFQDSPPHIIEPKVPNLLT